MEFSSKNQVAHFSARQSFHALQLRLSRTARCPNSGHEIGSEKNWDSKKRCQFFPSIKIHTISHLFEESAPPGAEAEWVGEMSAIGGGGGGAGGRTAGGACANTELGIGGAGGIVVFGSSFFFWNLEFSKASREITNLRLGSDFFGLFFRLNWRLFRRELYQFWWLLDWRRNGRSLRGGRGVIVDLDVWEHWGRNDDVVESHVGCDSWKDHFPRKLEKSKEKQTWQMRQSVWKL